jgi:hypothetical protein
MIAPASKGNDYAQPKSAVERGEKREFWLVAPGPVP